VPFMVETLPSARLSEMIATTPASPCGSCLVLCHGFSEG
jgi:hypothetical protein